MTIPSLLTLAQVAERLHCRPRTIAERIRRGEMEGFRVAERLLVSETALVRWLESQRVKATATPIPRYQAHDSTLAEGEIKRRLRDWRP